MTEPDSDLDGMSREELLAEAKKLRGGIRAHRDASGHNLCWFVPELWGLLPDTKVPTPHVPPTSEFLSCCAQYRASLEITKTFEEYIRYSQEVKALGPWEKHIHSYGCDCSYYPPTSGFRGVWWFRPDRNRSEEECYAFTEADRAVADEEARSKGYILFDK